MDFYKRDEPKFDLKEATKMSYTNLHCLITEVFVIDITKYRYG